LRRRLQSDPLTGEEVLVFAGPGAGKTLGALLAFSRMQQESHLKRVLVFCHRTSILEQWDRAAARLNLTPVI
jgi:superfamily II DNA or RNA helicase